MDAVSGLMVPKVLTVPQRGGRVDARWWVNSRDDVEPIDRKAVPLTQPAVPVPCYRVTNTAGITFVTTSVIGRDDAVDLGYFWSVLGYCYTAGTEEIGLSSLYRSVNSGTGDRLFTTSASEHAAALGSGYTAETADTFVFTSSAGGRIPVYRAFNSSTSIHTWTPDLRVIERLGSAWTLQEVSFYALYGPERSR